MESKEIIKKAQDALNRLAEIEFRSEGALQSVSITWLFGKEFDALWDLVEYAIEVENKKAR